MTLAEPVRLVCREDKLVRLLVELAIQRVDLILADRPMPAGTHVKGYSHKLGDCGITFFAEPRLAARFTDKWPPYSRCRPFTYPRQGSRGASTSDALVRCSPDPAAHCR